MDGGGGGANKTKRLLEDAFLKAECTWGADNNRLFYISQNGTISSIQHIAGRKAKNLYL